MSLPLVAAAAPRPSPVADLKQVDARHYAFQRYVTKGRWASVWHQIDEVVRLAPNRVLEIGPGPGMFKASIAAFGVRVETLDLDPELKPDHVASVTEMPFADRSYDVVCAFQMLEHLPYDTSLVAFSEMVRVARSHVVISLPDARATWRMMLHIPRVGTVHKLMPKWFWRPQPHVFDGEHYWEVNKRETPLARVVADFSARCPLERTYRVLEYPYHRFFVFKRA